ncbi:MAG: hypothetical protein KDC61_19115 [Saprospiraceae bacterium]|nr:hypothetical protein [Saprospiraceae bacterium]MCB0544799.1 hypothetical protein [Saprospiraceae bacterium]MCB0576677.1 hypothetical protein [Saprospiraceae bacterium]MCB9356010.1 hypothetical protein [Lewinellaceae bacterium]
MRNKKELRDLVADGQLTDAVADAVAYAEAAADDETLNGLFSLQSDLAKHRDFWNTGQISFEEFARAQARITSALVGRIDELPETPTRKATRQRIREDRFKWLVFYLFLLAKLLVLAWAVFMWQTEGFQNAEAFSLFNALLPGLIINASIMFRSLFRTSIESSAPRRFVSPRFRTLVWLAFMAYFVVQAFLIVQKVKGNLSFELASLAFAAVETALGQFMSEVVEGIFKKEK